MWHSDKSFLPDIVGGASAEKIDKIIFWLLNKLSTQWRYSAYIYLINLCIKENIFQGNQSFSFTPNEQ